MRSRLGTPTTRASRERAVSDVLAFTLTFAIIITAVALVSTGALTPLTAFTDHQQVINSERGMQATASTLDELHRSGDTYRQFDFVPGTGDLFVKETSITIESDDVELDELDGTTDTVDIQVNALTNRFDEDVSTAYEAGAVVRTDRARLSSDPSMRCGDTVIVSLVELSGDIETSGEFRGDVVLSPTSVPAAAPVGVNNRFVSFEVERGEVRQVRGDGEVTIDVSDTVHPERWSRYFEEAGWDAENDFEWSCEGENVLIRVVELELSQLGP